jgi:hypothetical protein
VTSPSPSPPRIEYAAFEEDLERIRLARQGDERTDLRVGHYEPEPVDRHAEAARRPADADVREPRDLEPAAHADAVDLRDHGMAATVDRLDRAAHHFSIGARLLDVGALVGEFGDVVARRKRLRSRAAQDDATRLILADSSANTSPSRCHIGLVSAFSFSGRFRTTVTMSPASWTRIVSAFTAWASSASAGRR